VKTTTPLQGHAIGLRDDDDDDDDDYAMFKSNRNSAKSDCGDCEKDLHTGRIPVVYLVLQFIYGLGRVIF